MKSTLIAASLLLTPLTAVAQPALAHPVLSQAAAGAVPNSFDGPSAANPTPTRPAQASTASPPSPAQAPAQAPDIARGEEALRSVIASVQGAGFDYS
ncbi:hypothetical protein LTR94_026136, partial [Friedmanniomyces endolithicus]